MRHRIDDSVLLVADVSNWGHARDQGGRVLSQIGRKNSAPRSTTPPIFLTDLKVQRWFSPTRPKRCAQGAENAPTNGTSLSVPANFIGSFVGSFVVSEPAEYGEFDKAQNKARDKDMLG